ncbi:MAG: OmpA family protein [Alloprevotella sp.]
MKKLMIALAFVGLSTTAFAQEGTEVPVKKYSVATNSFWANWFVSAGGQFTATYSSQEHNQEANKNPFSHRRGSFGFTVAVGKWFTPGIGLRTKFDGAWMRDIYNEQHANHPTHAYWNVHEDVMFNLSNLFCGYNEKRLWNSIPYVGVGVLRNMSQNAYDVSYNLGWLNNFRVSSRFQVFLDLSIALVEGSTFKTPGQPDPWAAYEKFNGNHWDKLVSASVGVTYNLGKHTWSKTPDVDALMAMNKEQMDALNASLKDQQDENARLRDLLAAEKAKKQPVMNNQTTNASTVNNNYVSTSPSVFFNIGSSKIASRKDLVNVKEIAEFAKQNGNKIVVTGYADSKTGSAEFNQKLSEKRAQVVADELVKMGVNRDNIEVKGAGGVNTISPYSYNRRATVQLQ